jgi:glycosyltransferase involved in cell wall biosynthesis
MWRVGAGNVLYLTGWCYHPDSPVADVMLVANKTAVPVNVTRLKRADIFKAHFPQIDPHGHSLYSGFGALVSVRADPAVTEIHLEIRARLRNGATVAASLGEIALLSAVTSCPRDRCADDRADIAICMTTFNPALELFARQIQSIRDQTLSSWVCIINDDCSRPELFAEISHEIANDSRFRLFRNETRLGFYRNFEKCLSRVPAQAQFIALADQDDCWHVDKLAALGAEFDEETTLVYSDMNIVGLDGRQWAGSFWTERRNNYTNLASLFFTNTITGAAAMFRRGLLRFLLPFPDAFEGAFHDHWIGCTALALGKIKFVNRPLHDYVQHGSNVIGRYTPTRRPGRAVFTQFLKAVRPAALKKRCRELLSEMRTSYFRDVLRIQCMAKIVEMRCQSRLSRAKQRVVHRIASLDSCLVRSIGWLSWRNLVSARGQGVTLGAEKLLLKGLWWRCCMGLISRFRSWRSLLGTPQGALLRTLNEGAQEAASLAPTDALLTGLERVSITEQKLAPLRVKVTAAVPARVNLLIPTIDFRYVFGGYITKFNLARCLAERGYKVRIIIVDYCDYQPATWRLQLSAYHGLEKLLDCVEIAYAYERSKTIEFHPRDALIATTWWTAHVAHQAVRCLQQERFVYLIQEFEPFTFPMGSHAALADETYAFPHYAVFSTELLRDYFRQSELGVFAEGRAAGERNSLAFENTITPVGTITAPELAGRSPKKLLYYARPEHHASRNMFETGIAGLMRAARAGYFANNWELSGIGTIETPGAIPLGNGITMRLLPRQTQDMYTEVLRSHDLGLSLMYTPHPSLVPIEMASAGMLTITNSCLNKTAERMREISGNLITVPPTIEGVQEGLKYALDNIENYEDRARGALVKWSTTWDQAFNRDVMARISKFLSACSDNQPAVEVRPRRAA